MPGRVAVIEIESGRVAAAAVETDVIEHRRVLGPAANRLLDLLWRLAAPLAQPLLVTVLAILALFVGAVARAAQCGHVFLELSGFGLCAAHLGSLSTAPVGIA